MTALKIILSMLAVLTGIYSFWRLLHCIGILESEDAMPAPFGSFALFAMLTNIAIIL